MGHPVFRINLIFGNTPYPDLSMALLQGFEHDIFISYRQKDNKYDGWVTEFVTNLKKELEATFKDDVSIYFDENPHDGLLETHNVDLSLSKRLNSLIVIPIVSQTYCDPKSFAWQHEFLAFLKLIRNDRFGQHVKLANGNVASRILPVRIHDLEPEDLALFENETGELLRSVDFIYRLPGVNRQLRAKDDEQVKGTNQTIYRDQINKVARAIKEIVQGLKQADQPSGATTPKQKTIPAPQTVDAPAHPSRSNLKLILGAALFAMVAATAYFTVPGYLKKNHMRNEVLPAIQEMVNNNFTAPSRAFELALEADKVIADDSVLINLWPKVSRKVKLETIPSGADVYWKDYERPADAWKKLGTTPMMDVRIPFGVRFKIERSGFETLHVTTGRIGPENKLKLDSIGTIPANMVRIPARTTPMLIVGLEQYQGQSVPEFLADKYEVTNAQFKEFVDAGGYQNPTFWPNKFIKDGKAISREEALKTFVDKTGKPGPAGWEVGSYPNGLENHPVSGISWYEADAYARFAGKQLPTVFHWSVIAETNRTMVIVPKSNYNGQSTVPVGSLEGISSFGIYDLAGNVREWCANPSGTNGLYFSLGGAWNDATYAFNDAYMVRAMDRSVGNGFRCIQLLKEGQSFAETSRPVSMMFRDYTKEKPVDDQTFEFFRRQYAYDPGPINAQVKVMADTGIWHVEQITMDAAYNKERLVIYLFMPRNGKVPVQPVIYYPGSNVIYEQKFTNTYVNRLEFIIRSGRAIAIPVFKGTFERHDELKSDLPDNTVFYKDHVIMWRKDLSRTIDYLETRTDIAANKIGYFGWSWGGYLGGIIPAIETRIKCIVLHVGGMVMNPSLPEVDQLNFLPRVKQPVLMLNGKHDLFFPVETAQKPMFNLLGTPAKDKKINIYDAGHLVPRTELIRESLNWYDKYLGTVN